ncbi:MAG TPA: hypothetical protein VFT13_13895 [Candidatus Krumholzibacteria bacterium]|nr:hypothetical protein [Candidatus Krumholzibacteria bacterium]
MRFEGLFRLVATACLCALAPACAQPAGPSVGGPVYGSCVTDFSCPFGAECAGSGCAPIATTLLPHIQTASMLARSALDDGEQAWRAAHYDLNISRLHPDLMRAQNPNVILFEYGILRYHLFDNIDDAATAWAIAHGYDPEDFYLHYKEDVTIPTWGGAVLVPGFPPGVVPGWNPTSGGNPASATERWQSRALGSNNATPWYLGNMAHPGYRQFLVEYARRLITGTWFSTVPFATGPVDGIMCDLGIYYPQFLEGQIDKTAEYYGVPLTEDHPYAVAVETVYPYLAGELVQVFGETKRLMPNYGHVFFLNYANRSAINVQATTPWIWGEVWVTYTGTWSPTSGNNRCITYERDYANGVAGIVEQTRSGGRRVIGARDVAAGSAGTDRGKLFTLGLYYLALNAHTYYMYETVGNHAGAAHISTWSWNPAVEFDVGQPDVVPTGMVDFAGNANTKEHYLFATGSDPYNNALTYRVFARNFTNALVLVKMLPEGSVTDDRSITAHALDGTYAPLQADGNIGAAVTEATIRNNEALILIRLDQTGIRRD